MEMNRNVFQALQDALHAIETNLGPGSSIFKQLANSESCYGNLQRQLQVVEPMLGSLSASVKAVESTETELVRGLETFGKKLSDAQIPAENPVLEMEISRKFAENTQLQLRLQEISTEIESLRKQLAKTSSENQHLQDVLTETATNEQTYKSKNARLEIEKTALRGELQMIEQRLREELGNESIKLQSQMKAKFEEEVRELEAEKSRLKRDCDQLQAQVTSIQSSLVSPWLPMKV
jgi:chromosome segregation ATPase